MTLTRSAEVEVAESPPLRGLTGWAQHLVDDQPVPEHPVVGIICASDFPDLAIVGEVIAVGADRDPETVWVVRKRDKIAVEALEALSQEYVEAGLNPWFKHSHTASELVEDTPGRRRYSFELKSADNRASVRESEIVRLCTRVIVFRTPNTSTLDFFNDGYGLWDHIRVIERGKKAKKKYRKGKSSV